MARVPPIRAAMPSCFNISTSYPLRLHSNRNAGRRELVPKDLLASPRGTRCALQGWMQIVSKSRNICGSRARPLGRARGSFQKPARKVEITASTSVGLMSSDCGGPLVCVCEPPYGFTVDRRDGAMLVERCFEVEGFRRRPAIVQLLKSGHRLPPVGDPLSPPQHIGGPALLDQPIRRAPYRFGVYSRIGEREQ